MEIIVSVRSKPKLRAEGVAGGNRITTQPVIARNRKEYGNRITTTLVIARNRKEYGNRITTTLVIASRAQPDEAIAFMVFILFVLSSGGSIEGGQSTPSNKERGLCPPF